MPDTTTLPSTNGRGSSREVAPPAGKPGHPPPDTEAALAHHVRAILDLVGEDPDRAGLEATPQRVARSLRQLTRGYRETATDALGDALFEEEHDSLILVRDVEVFSLCEHHLLPFHGVAHVAYVPNGKVVGLSKIARIVEVFARRLQVQERLTDQIADALTEELNPRGVGVVIEAQHMCMMMRGVEKTASRTWTRALRGSLESCPSLRDEFLRLVGPGR